MIVIGIDIGTTSVKATLLMQKLEVRKVLCSVALDHHADINMQSMDKRFSEQDPSAIFKALESCIESMSNKMGRDVMQQAEIISICGQMHGCMLWKSKERSRDLFTHSKLITWRDQRCDQEFLHSLPEPENCVPTSTGFGCATLFWLQRYQMHVLDDYDCAGTIMDFVIANLCHLEKPWMSTQNAMSWGFYNFCTEEWNVRILRESDFPVGLLPNIGHPGDEIGKLKFDWCGIKAGAQILIGCGDMQCSVLSCNPSENVAVFNLGTSAQLSVLSKVEKGKVHYEKRNSKSVESRICVPYFGDKCLWTSASLNGGAVYEMFVTEMYEWTKRFSANVRKEDIYLHIQEIACKEIEATTAMKIIPTIYGERHAPLAKASMEGIGAEDCKISRVAIELAVGIVANVFQMHCLEGADANNVEEVWGCGTPFQKNQLFRRALEQVSGVPCVFHKTIDAAYGAAVFALAKSQ